jgi:hypothetical protein
MLLSLLLSFHALATTFGPIPVTGQVKNGQYVVHGRISGSSWVAEERETRRPYTHWKLRVIEQPKGESLGEEITMRQPGGEIGEFGYHVAGSATFRDNEETFVVLRDTDEAGIKEVLGLASGKYTVEKDANGQSVLRSGLGFVIRNENGQPYSPETFTAMVKRVAKGEETEGDKTVFVNKGMAHEHDPVLEARTAEALKAKSQPVSSLAPPPPGKEKSELSPPPAVEESPASTEEPKSSSWWIYAFLAALGLAGAVYFLKRK